MKIQIYILVLIVGMFVTKVAIANKILLIQDIDKECGSGEAYTPGEVDKGTTDDDNADDNDEPDDSPRDCAEIYAKWDSEGELYESRDIYPDGSKGPKLTVVCWNNWINVLVRRRGNLNFDKSFEDYKNGFDRKGNFWLGLENIHKLTSKGSYQLLVQLYFSDDTSAEIVYSGFSVGPGPDYQLTISGFSVSDEQVGDCLTILNGENFSSHNDTTGMSIQHGGAGWWYPSGEGAAMKCSFNGVHGSDKQTGMFYFDKQLDATNIYISILEDD